MADLDNVKDLNDFAATVPMKSENFFLRGSGSLD